MKVSTSKSKKNTTKKSINIKKGPKIITLNENWLRADFVCHKLGDISRKTLSRIIKRESWVKKRIGSSDYIPESVVNSFGS